MEERAFSMAAQEINLRGGIRGRELDLMIADTSGDAERARSAAERLIVKEGVQVLSGGISSTATLAAASVAQKRSVPFLVTTASANEITEKGWGYVFRLSAPRSDQPKALASFLQKAVGVRTSAILYEDSPAGRYGMKEFWSRSKAMGLDTLLIRRHPPGVRDLKDFVNKISSAAPQMVCVVSEARDAAFFLWSFAQADIQPMLFFGRGEGFSRPEFRQFAGELSEYVVSTTPWAPSVRYPEAGEFAERFTDRFGTPPDYHAAQAYAAMSVLENAFRRARTLEPRDIRETLGNTETVTVFGRVKFESPGRMARQNRAPTLVVQWIKGRLETVWPREIASAPHVFPFPAWSDR
jgi:branched-chain amino acid transport system substrate-binding protein